MRGRYAPSYFSLYFAQSIDCGNNLLLLISALLLLTVPLLSISLSDFCRLQVQCASCKFSMSLGCPPLANGIIWSIHGDNGCGYFNLKSTGFPHIPQILCVAYIFFLFFSNAPLWVPSLSALNVAANIIHTLLPQPCSPVFAHSLCLPRTRQKGMPCFKALPSLGINQMQF